jgi:hypothetical protein
MSDMLKKGTEDCHISFDRSSPKPPLALGDLRPTRKKYPKTWKAEPDDYATMVIWNLPPSQMTMQR